MKTKSGFVSIVGKPNVGKSTLMNGLLGEELSIVTAKPQTTRKRVLGIVSEDNYQIVFLDTPGMLTPKYMMQQKLTDYINMSVKDSDVIIFMISADSKESLSAIFDNNKFNSEVLIKNKKKILVINKIDLVKQEILKGLNKDFSDLNFIDAVIPVSAKENYNIDLLNAKIIEFLPYHPKFYPDDQLTDEPERFFVSEKIREKVFEQYKDEIPYSVEVLIDEFKERKKGKDYISAIIVVERESQKPIILGKKGSKIKKLGNSARKSIEEFLLREVYLELRVKVVENWRKNEKMLDRFGYSKR